MDKQKKPTFVWQGTLIMLPVLILAIVSLALVHRDQQATEQEARDRAAQSAQALARAVLNSAIPELEGYAKLATNPATTQWQSKYPGLNIDDLLLPPGAISATGQILRPATFDTVPEPPRWFLDLSPQQLQLWRALSEASPTTVQTACETFIKSGPSADAVLAARNILWAAGLGHESDRPEIPTESGIAFGDVYCFRQFTAGGPLTQSLLNRLQTQVVDRPSFVTPALLDLADRAANGSPAELQRQLRLLRHRWQRQSTARDLLRTLHSAPVLNGPTPQALWLKTDAARALAFLTRPEGSQTWTVTLIPTPVVQAAFTRALSENRFIAPSYTAASMTLEGEPLQDANGGMGATTRANSGGAVLPAPNLPILAQTTQTASTWPLHLAVNLYLADPSQLYTAERRTAWLLGSLVAGTVLTALVGLLVARRAFHQQLRLNELKSNFVSAVSHELRAPIASVRLLAEGLDRGKIADPQKQKEYFRFIVQECRRLSSLIGNVLDFSRIDQGRKKYEFEPADLVALVEQTVALMTPAAAERQVQVLFPHANDLSAQLTCDSLAIQQALINLVDNAVKHSPSGSTVTVGLDKTEQPSEFHLWVEDHGSGIPPEEHEKIFERFYRRGSELRRETQGIGIGLTIVKHIVEAHHGRIRVRSAVGQGSRFTMELGSVTQKQNG